MEMRGVCLVAVLVLAAGLPSVAAQFLSNGAPCGFPFLHEGKESYQCVPFGGGGEWCRGLTGVWGPCKSYEYPAPPLERKAVRPDGVVIQPCCARLVKMKFETNLPVVIIDTGGEEIPDEPKTEATMCTCGSEDVEFNGPIGIEIRGSTSARDYEKKSFALETRNENGTAEDVKLLGLPKENDWVLYGPEADATLGFRNLIAYTLSRGMGRYASRLKYCELFLVQDGKPLNKNHYNGVYLLAEKVKRGKNRVDISKQKEDDLSGGYIFKYDNDNNDDGDTLFNTQLSQLQMILVYPRRDDATPEAVKALTGYVNEFEKALISDKFKDPEVGYRTHIDMGSFVDYFLISEITKNPDSYRGSAFVHKDEGKPIAMGPVWDYNEAFGVCCGFPIEGFQKNGHSTGQSGGSAISPEGWRFLICIEQQRCRVDPLDGLSLWYRRMWLDPAFRNAVKSRWTELRAYAFSDELISEYLEETKTRLRQAALRNYKRWSEPLKASSSNSANFELWMSHIDTLERWLYKHLAWMDLQLIREPIEIPRGPAPGEAGEIENAANEAG